MTTNLEFYSGRQGMAQALALRDLHQQACAQADAPPLADGSGSPFQSKQHTQHAVLCGDFNLVPSAPEYVAIQEPFRPLAQYGSALTAINNNSNHWRDAWPLVHGQTPHAPTFRLFDNRYSPDPITCDYVFVSDSLAGQVKTLTANLTTQASDHQPLLLVLA